MKQLFTIIFAAVTLLISCKSNDKKKQADMKERSEEHTSELQSPC